MTEYVRQVIDDFGEARNKVFANFDRTQRNNQLILWKQDAKDLLSPERLQYYTDYADAKTSQNGLLVVAHELAVEIGLKNPFLYCHEMKTLRQRRAFLLRVLKNLSHSQKNNSFLNPIDYIMNKAFQMEYIYKSF